MTDSTALTTRVEAQGRPAKVETAPLPLLWSQLKPDERQQLAQQLASLIHQMRTQSQGKEAVPDAPE
jgi:hypothetical protein